MRKMKDWRGVRLKPIHEPDEPIPGETEDRLTKERDAQPLCQVFVETKPHGRLAISPKIGSDVCAAIVASVNKAIIDGKLPDWGNPHIELAA